MEEQIAYSADRPSYFFSLIFEAGGINLFQDAYNISCSNSFFFRGPGRYILRPPQPQRDALYHFISPLLSNIATRAKIRHSDAPQRGV